MVFNPPVLKQDADNAEKPVKVTVSPARSGDAYVEQAKRAAAWIGLLLICWLFQRLMCHFDLPPHCDLPSDALEVLTDLLALLVFGLTQAWFCEVLEERRFRHLTREAYFGIVIIVMGLIVSAIETTDWFQDFRFDDNSDWRDSHIVVAVVLITFVLVIVAYHFAEAWRTLPGAYYVSGNINLDIVIEENLHRIYNVSRGLIVSYALLYGAFAFEEGDGLKQHYVLLAWVLSLIAQFKSRPSIIWLALCTGVFIQGLGSYRLRFLCEVFGNFGNGFGVPGSGFGSSDSGDNNFIVESSDSVDSTDDNASFDEEVDD
ncbi:unnamed protein product [Ectocarpus sp. 12 AP-2014]